MGLSSWQVMAGAHRKERQRADALQKMQTAAELKWLKAQINPHFLFNALHNIYTLAYIKSEEAAPMILKLGNIMRYVMQQGDSKTVPIEDEINYVRDYLALQSLKQVNQAKTTIHITNNATQVMVAPMLFINFIENAYKQSKLEDENAWIKIDWHISRTQIHFVCSNTYSSGSAKDVVGGIGLENVKTRLQLLYPAHVLQINASKRVYVVDLIIPLS
jgi:two-component system, LytTR family, sensor kinase